MRGAAALLAALLLLPGLPAAADDAPASQGKAAIQFKRPLTPGSQFDCDISTSCSRSFLMKMPGVDAPAAKAESSSAILAGRMTVIEVNEVGNPAKISFEIKAFSGVLDHASVQLDSFKGRVIVATLTAPCKFAFASSPDEPLQGDAVRLLSTIFRPAQSSSMADLLGTSEPLGPGDSWTPPRALLLSSLAQRGIKLSEKDFECVATLSGRESFRGIECWRISDSAQAVAPGFEMRLDIKILLPCDPALGGAVKISRSGTEFVSKTLPETNPLSAGKTVEATVKDSMEATALPVLPSR